MEVTTSYLSIMVICKWKMQVKQWNAESKLQLKLFSAAHSFLTQPIVLLSRTSFSLLLGTSSDEVRAVFDTALSKFLVNPAQSLCAS